MITDTTEVELSTQALAIVDQAGMVKITDQRSYDAAASVLLNQIKPFRKSWKEYWSDIKKPLREALDKVQEKFNDGDTKMATAEAYVKREIERWDSEQERLLQERQRMAQLEAEKRAEDDQARMEMEAELSGATEDQVQEMIAETSAVVVAAPVQPTYQRASGISKRDNWVCVVDDIKALCKAIGAGKVPVSYVLPNESALNARARADKKTMVLPGCRSENRPVISGRGK